MSTRTAVLVSATHNISRCSRAASAGLLVALLSVCAADAHAQSSVGLRYEPILEWNGPYFVPFHSPGLEIATDYPPVELPFQQPRAVAVTSHSGRDVVYVLDSGRHRVQAFEVNGTFEALSQDDMAYNAGAPAAGEYNDQLIRLPEYLNVPTQWIVPRSEAVYVDGSVWRWVEDLTGYTTDDQVYTIDYAAAADQPQIELPAGSLDADSQLEIRYLVTDLQDVGAGTPQFGQGDVDYGTRDAGTTVTKVQIDETSGGPTEWEEVRSLVAVPDPVTSTTDLLFIVDAADLSGAQDEKVFTYTVALDGTVTAGESYGGELDGPYDVAVLDLDAGKGASASLSADTGPFDQASYPFVADANQVTGHDYRVSVATGIVTITDLVTGRVLVDQAAEAAFADPFLGIPGLSLPLNAGPWGDGTTTISTSAAYPGRFLVITDTGNDRIKIVGLPSSATVAGSNWSGDWLPKDARTVVVQPTGAGTLGATAGRDYRPSTPSLVPEDWVSWTTTAPLAEGTLDEIIFDPDVDPRSWLRVDDLHTASPSDSVFQVDWESGRIRFGDGIHGAIPPASTDFEYDYEVSPDLVRFGTSGTGAGRFTSPRGVSGLWNDALGRFDLYVADAGNHRIQKLTFEPADTTLGVAPRVQHLVTWDASLAGALPLQYPYDVETSVDGDGTTYVAVSDPGNQRIVIFRDPDREVPGAHLGIFDASLGQLGNRLGNFVSPARVAFLANGSDLDVYVPDESRHVVTKYEEGPTPTITLLFTGDSELPACFPPSAGYPIRFTTTHPPLGGWVDFYYDTQETFDPSRAKLAIEAGTVPPTATSAYWDFDATPGGNPGAGDYYLFARLKDPTGTEVAWDQTFDPEVVCIDPTLVPALLLTDAIDGDRTLYLQNGLVRDVHLQLVYPDSIIGAGFYGTFDPSIVEVLGITPGTAWEGIGYTDHVFGAVVDTVSGTFEVNSTTLGAPTGLSGAGPFNVATMQVRARPNAISATERFKDSVLSLDKSRSSIIDVRGEEPAAWAARSCQIRIAYLGDIATTGAGADSTVPHLQPRPDGRIDFDDQMAFTIGWNGTQFTRDRIADMGPATGDSPNLWPVPDAEWDVDDILAFTSQYSYFSQAGWNSAGFVFTLGADGLAREIASAFPSGSSSATYQAAHLTWQIDAVAGGIELRLETLDVDRLTGARLDLRYPEESFGYAEGQADAFLETGGAQVLHLVTEDSGRLDLGISRLSVTASGVSGSGTLAVFRLRYRDMDAATNPSGPLELSFDLRDAENEVVEAGTIAIPWNGRSSSHDIPTQAFLGLPQPNPMSSSTWVEYGLPEASDVQIHLYTVDGRKVDTLVSGIQDAGTYRVQWSGRSSSGTRLATGRYFLEMRAGSFRSKESVLVLR